ncbi:outer membrane transport energization protein ExbD [Consotaella salsifontis]|uniref:Outer membrane transport energization protein ExbD n=2 Tax=Consotaella salsifontis TaxID=1365950 RepID=A0A1T4TE64_9HYPH|nr:outer membrane transport energization protein ExbD [Consotaella salsifontis]
MTSLIDVIFLLLLFFMLSSTFSRFAEIPLGAAGAGGSGGNVPDIFATIAEDGVRINGEAAEPTVIAERLRALSEAGAKSATVLAREGATSQMLVDVLEKFRAAGIDVGLAR